MAVNVLHKLISLTSILFSAVCISKTTPHNTLKLWYIIHSLGAVNNE